MKLSTDQKKEGNGAAKLSWTSGGGMYQAAFLTLERLATDITGRSFEVCVMPLDDNAGNWRVTFFDVAGQMVEMHQLYSAKANEWTCMKFTQGKQSGQGWFYRKGSGDPTKVVRVQFAGTTKENSPAGTISAVLWDGFKLVDAEK